MPASNSELTEVDRILMRRSFDDGITKSRTWFAMLFGFVFLMTLIVAKIQGASTNAFFWAAIIYVFFTTCEKTTHCLAILAYKKLVRKLVRAIDADFSA